MKKITASIIFVFVSTFTLQAQYVSIPDAAFKAVLMQKFPTCFNGAGMMDTTCNKITDTLTLYCTNSSINDLTGIRYFKKLQLLDCSNNQLTKTGNFPDSLQTLRCNGNPDLTCLGKFPLGLKTLLIDSNSIQCLPNTVVGLKVYGKYSYINGNWTYTKPLTRLLCYNTSQFYPPSGGVFLGSSCPQNSPTMQVITCPDSMITLVSPIKGTTYSWKRARQDVDFVNRNEFIDFIESSSDTLRIPKSQLLDFTLPGYYTLPIKYFCFVDNAYYSLGYTIDFFNTWTGANSTAWEDPANWSCGKIPDKYTFVIIPAGKTVVISSNPIIKNIKVNNGANLTVNTSYNLTLIR